mmetsp:Transcript_33906/g.76677  ORF Transcript_33906/g.76677 Transcript_33906/m.76677 type:complete len:304 (-) Transcript_33906:222-1133(-)
MSIVRSFFFRLSLSHMSSLRGCQVVGARAFIMCTRMASKMAPAMACSGIEIASSSSEMAGYLAFLIFESMLRMGLVSTLPLDSTVTCFSNMNCTQAFHQAFEVPRSTPLKQLITVGRIATPPSARLIVLVYLSGMEASRFFPMVPSLMKPLMMRRSLYSVAHRRCTSSTPSQPACFILSHSSSNMAWVNTSCTGTSLSPGSLMNCETSSISLLYLGSSWVIQYSNGLLLIAAMFHVMALKSSGGPVGCAMPPYKKMSTVITVPMAPHPIHVLNVALGPEPTCLSPILEFGDVLLPAARLCRGI